MGKNASHIPKGDGEKNQMADGEKNQMMGVYTEGWVPNWYGIQRREETLSSQNFVFRTRSWPTVAETKWSLGLKVHTGGTEFQVYFKLIEITRFPEEKIESTAVCTFRKAITRTDVWTETQQKTMTVGEVLVVPKILTLNSDGRGFYINPNEHPCFILTLKIMEPKLTKMEPKLPSADLKMELFHKTSIAQLCVNFKSLLGDQATADLTIKTSDGKELFAHKAILKAQCTVFDSMFRSELSGNKTGIVIVKDVSSKTMEILLHYFYTGVLLQSWKDEENVVEFTYAVGKFQLTNVLKLLDEVVGSRNEKDDTNTNMQLLDLVQKLGLKTAERELLERIKMATSNVNRET